MKFTYMLRIHIKQNIISALTGLKHLIEWKAFVEYSNDMDDSYQNIEEYNPNKKRTILIVFDDMIADILSSKKLIEIKLFIRGRKLSNSLVFIAQTKFCCTKKYYTKFYTLFNYQKSKKTTTSANVILSVIHQILTLETYESLQKMYCKLTFFLVIDAALASDNLLRFRRNLLEKIKLI